MTTVRLEPAAIRSRVKHSTTEPLRSLESLVILYWGINCYVLLIGPNGLLPSRVGVIKIVIVINCNLITFSKVIACNCN